MSSRVVVRVRAGRHDRRDCPLTVEIDESVEVAGFVHHGKKKHDPSGEKVIPAQREGREVTFVLPRVKAGREVVLQSVNAVPAKATKKSRAELVELAELGDEQGDRIEVRLGGKLFGAYHYGSSLARPMMWPLIGPGGIEMTRAWPVAERPREQEDHPHHKSFWVAHGLVNGVDNWSETEGHGFQVHKAFTKKVAGCVYAELAMTNTWESAAHEPTCEEDRAIRVMRLGGGSRLVDLTVRFRATQGDLVFGDTKEGGICSIRVPSSMAGENACIVNSAGGAGEDECWGAAAHWVDYSGAAGGKHRGIAVFDHPMNLRHPTRWHVRSYGLFGANPFGLSHYKKGLEAEGSYTLPAGGELVFRYRILLHKGDAEDGRVAARYVDWVAPPEVKVEA